MRQAVLALINLWRSLLGAFIFYTILLIPNSWNPSFHRIARWCPLVGLIIGGILSSVFLGLSTVNAPSLIRGIIVTSLWLGITGGLHLDGAMDSADGLAVTNPDKRLEVMADSVTGAFGAMTAIIILLFKFAAIASLAENHWWLLLFIPMWGRWSQVVAIALFPYLKPKGKGAFHKRDFNGIPDLITATLPAISLLGIFRIASIGIFSIAQVTIMSITVAIAISFWFKAKFNGHTGDTYGATVEWTESIAIALGSLILQ
ncbi:Cobalamin synthase [[Leptolyngbya] sp. PCC 7376]|uniref:adenosylcobinamide-GDP ribazoletransferase n=1 Tax=[Leptolyngbya] sp. PCC 7376 TaxID=111781 RepID=UPI00029F00C3|nr:adenosylcobinamide-GDP ribazoletransferase [[Leptolyngbya] sp. PCC 7376]AFY37830.1 Cobalamin synthase [[Leptolyngbya] sp. PCC 7376]